MNPPAATSENDRDDPTVGLIVQFLNVIANVNDIPIVAPDENAFDDETVDTTKQTKPNDADDFPDLKVDDEAKGK